MRLYLVERYTPSLDAGQVAAAVSRVAALDAPENTHMWTVLIPAEKTCLSLFTATSAAVVATANARAGFTFARIVDAMSFPADDSPNPEPANPEPAKDEPAKDEDR